MEAEAILNLAAILNSVMIWIIVNQSDLVNLNFSFYIWAGVRVTKGCQHEIS